MINIAHIWAMTLRHWYILRRSPPQVINNIGWPAVNTLIWGFMNQYLSQAYGGEGYIAGSLLMAAIFWDVFMRASWGTTGCIYEEYAARNLGPLMASPMTMSSYIASCFVASFMKGLVSFIAVIVAVPLIFDFSIFALGWHLLAYIPVLLIFGWAIGLMISSFLFIWGLRAESLCWFTPMIFAAFMAPYYPVDSLPAGAYAFSMMLPPTHMFEAMRADMAGLPVDWSFLSVSLGLGCAWLMAAAIAFSAAFEWARRHGRLLAPGN
jgi:ABC-2 type transport system permease protein